MLIPAFRIIGVAAAFGLMVACNGDPISAPANRSANLEVGPLDDQEVVGAVKVCTFHGEGTFTTTQAQVNPNTLIEPLETIGTVASPDCSVVWKANLQPGVFDVTVTQTDPDGFSIWARAIFYTPNSGQIDSFNQDPNPCDGSPILVPTATVKVGVDVGAVIWFKQCPVLPPPPPPPPPGDCVGLTPGYWKNWKNHYTKDQFETLIAGTSFPSLTTYDATKVLGGNNPAAVRLYKFLLANELTRSLTNQLGLPNPSGGSLTGSCEIDGSNLEETLALARLMQANPGDFTEAQLLAMGDLLDAFANMDD